MSAVIHVCLAAVLLLAGAAPAQDEPEMTDLQRAGRYLQTGDNEASLALLRGITAREPENGAAWIQLGVTLHNLHQYEQAAEAWLRAEAIPATQVLARYNLGCAYARLDDYRAAFEWLEQAVRAGFSDVRLLETDSDLVDLRSDPRFDDVLMSADANARPCQHDARCRQLDFWLGEWDVYNNQGVLIGANTITSDMNGCVIQEHWISPYSPSGVSMNYFDHTAGVWRQLWIGAGRSIVRYEGRPDNGAMHFLGVSINPDGSVDSSRMVLTPQPDGTVRQVIENSTDGGDWQPFLEGHYVLRDRRSPDE